ncbi:Protein of unknown function (DUF3550/UPF0682) [Abeliophyllum distichum]|uniref:Protein SCAI n=1 Tax=Abeliophyllum distichum TaxID=126358 RepID=A0ABD1SVS7_9LAMI
MLIYLSAPGSSGHGSTSQMVSSGNSIKCLKPNPEQNHVTAKGDSSHYFDNYLWLGPGRNGGSNILFPGDIIPFTRRPLFLIVDSDNSHAFKAGLSKLCTVLHGAERGEAAALFLSPLKPSFNKHSGADMAQNGSQFTLFLTTPLQAFCRMVDCNSSDDDSDVYNDAETILSTAFSEWEVILCTSTNLDLVWAQLLSDPFLRRLILRFIFCRAVLALFQESDYQYIPVCLPELPSSLSPNSKAVQLSIKCLANHLKVADCFLFRD